MKEEIKFETKSGDIEFQFDGAEGGMFWITATDWDEETMSRLSFEEAEKIRDFLNYWLPCRP